MNNIKFNKICRILKKICNKFTLEYKIINPDIIFDIYQLSELYYNYLSIPYDIGKFYNNNMMMDVKLPNYQEISNDNKNNPIFIIYNRKTKELLGIATVTYEEDISNDSFNLKYLAAINDNYALNLMKIFWSANLICKERNVEEKVLLKKPKGILAENDLIKYLMSENNN